MERLLRLKEEEYKACSSQILIEITVPEIEMLKIVLSIVNRNRKEEEMKAAVKGKEIGNYFSFSC